MIAIGQAASLCAGLAGGGPAGLPAAEQAAAEERAFQGPVAVHTAAAEPGYLTGRVQAGDRAGPAAKHPARQVGLQPAERLAGQDVEPDGDQRTGLGVEDLVR